MNHSQALSAQPLEPWLLVKLDGMVKAAHCTCMAGLGEACSHIAAVLFFLKAAAEHRDNETCTDRENAWLPPYVTNVPSAQISAIDFSSAQAKKRKLDDPGQRAAKKKKTAQIAKPTQQEWASFLEKIKETDVEPSALSVTKGYSQYFIPLEVKHSTALLTNLTRNTPPNNMMAECEMFAKAFKTEEKVRYPFQEIKIANAIPFYFS